VNKISSLGIVTLLVGAVLGSAFVQPAQAQSGGGSQAQALDEYLKMVRGDLAKRRDSALRGLLQLDDAEAKTFWPLQQAYDAELKRISDARLFLVREFGQVYDKLTAEKAKGLAVRFFELDDQRIALHRKYFERISEEVSPVVAVQFIQLQRQFETMASLKLATNAPLAVK
jgi:hypothetical protein